MKVRIDCDLSEAHEAKDRLNGWLDDADTGDMDGDDMIHRLNGIIEQLQVTRSGVVRALGW